MTRFSGKTVLITGASSGMGLAAAKRLSEEGANIVGVARGGDRLESALAALPADRTLAHAADVGDAGAAKGAVDAAVDRFGGVDVLVSNAGINRSGAVHEMEEGDWNDVMRINVGGLFHMTKAAWPYLKAAKGNIVVTSSVSGLGGDWGQAAYTASKGAITNLVRSMAQDYGADGVRVNAIAPSFTKTEMTSGMDENEALMEAFMKRIPMQRPGYPEDIAPVIAFLASDDARFVTGVNLPVDGGVSASNGQPALG